MLAGSLRRRCLAPKKTFFGFRLLCASGHATAERAGDVGKRRRTKGLIQTNLRAVNNLITSTEMVSSPRPRQPGLRGSHGTREFDRAASGSVPSLPPACSLWGIQHRAVARDHPSGGAECPWLLGIPGCPTSSRGDGGQLPGLGRAVPYLDKAAPEQGLWDSRDSCD